MGEGATKPLTQHYLQYHLTQQLHHLTQQLMFLTNTGLITIQYHIVRFSATETFTPNMYYSMGKSESTCMYLSSLMSNPTQLQNVYDLSQILLTKLEKYP